MSKVKTYIISILIPVALGGLVGFLISGSMNYDQLNQPPLSPPGILFPIVWSILYILMGVSYGMLKTRALADIEVNLIYFVQLGVNLLWPIAFFVLQWRLFAFFWIILLDVLVIAMIVKFYRRYKTAGYLQIPYLAWVLFASYLNLGVYILNR